MAQTTADNIQPDEHVSTIEAQFKGEIADSIRYLDSSDAQHSMELDAYWPKWNSPWWHMTLLWELGLAASIPQSAIDLLLNALQQRYLHSFPFRIEDVPPGVDPIGDVMCHCGLGTTYQILSAVGVDVDRELPWARQWFVQYQIQDGGWNCQESTYLKEQPKSSLVSTLPILESMLLIQNPSNEELTALDAGAQYLLKRQLVRSLKDSAIINEDWMKLSFPRFYEYDVLRGLAFVTNWAKIRQYQLPTTSIEFAQSAIARKLRDGQLPIERNYHKTCKTRIKDSDGVWVSDLPVSEFPLLKSASQIGSPCFVLTRSWNSIQQIRNAESV